MSQTALAALLLALLALACLFLLKYLSRTRPDYPYELQPSILTPAERNFYRVLIDSVPPGVLVFCKPRIADVLKVRSLGADSARWQRAFNRINAKHFDFVLCDEEELEYLCAIELNDSSHELPSRQKRDLFVTNACYAAQLPLMMHPAQQHYSAKELRLEIEQLIG